MRPVLFAVIGLAAFAGLSSSSCTVRQPDSTTYFDRTVSPVLSTSCVRGAAAGACHVADAKGNAFGNLDVATFDGINHRRDLLANYGPYGQPALLVKNIPPFTVDVQSFDGTKATITTDIKHAGGPILDPTATGYQVLRRWIENGATANNSGVAPSTLTRLPCSTTIGSDPSFDPTKNQDPMTADFGQFRDQVAPVMKTNCAASNCHGTTSNELYLTCGDSPEQVRWNYFAATEYMAQTPEQSELVRRPLAPSLGGSFHEGGAIFTSINDDSYQAILKWATAHGPLSIANPDPNFVFFTHKVQPMLVKKGCMMLQCHSAAMFHDYRLRGGSGGSFSLSATKRNYALSIAQLSLDSDDVDASRLVAKNLFRPGAFATGQGTSRVTHRGGALLEDFKDKNATPAICDTNPITSKPYDYDNGDLDKIPAYCVIKEWHKRERAARNLAPMSAIVYVSRATPQGSDRAQDFETYEPNSDLHIVDATLANAAITLGTDRSVSAGCGLTPATADIKRPAVSWDGKKIAFAARTSAGEPLQIYEMNADGTNCKKHAEINAGGPSVGGMLVHNFDPQYSPPDAKGVVKLVFASTRGVNHPNFDYSGPQRTPADPTKLNANLYVFEPNAAAIGSMRVRELTFQLNMERYPSFMSDGRVIFDTEKREPGFYQLALRRINLDGGDYHPLFGQRSSVGNHEVSQVVELADKNFAAIFADGAAHQGGALGVFNRSLGVDFKSADPKDYPIDPTVIDPNASASPDTAFFLRSLQFPDTNVSGKAGTPTKGLYSSPAALPNGNILVSYGAAADPKTFGGDYDVYVVDPINNTSTKLFGAAGTAEVQAVAVFARANKGVFGSAFDEPNGHTIIQPEDHFEAQITVLDVPLLASLLFQNTPTGRPIEDFSTFQVFEEMPPPTDMTTFAAGGANVATDDFGQVYVRRRLLGTVPIESDHSAKFTIPGGVPIVLQVPETATSKGQLPRVQREEMSFYPGEYTHQSFRRQFFSGLCAQCHNSISGRALDVAVQPDMLTQASNIIARSTASHDLNAPPASRSTTFLGPPAKPW